MYFASRNFKSIRLTLGAQITSHLKEKQLDTLSIFSH